MKQKIYDWIIEKGYVRIHGLEIRQVMCKPFYLTRKNGNNHSKFGDITEQEIEALVKLFQEKDFQFIEWKNIKEGNFSEEGKICK